jgi:CRP-like cAMP-binding protein
VDEDDLMVMEDDGLGGDDDAEAEPSGDKPRKTSWQQLQSSEILRKNKALFRTINKIQFFNRLEVEDKESVITKLQHAEYGEGDVIFEQGDLGDCFYIVTSGMVQVKKNLEVEGEDGVKRMESKVVVEMGEGDYFGEVALTNEGDVRTATIAAKNPVRCVFLTREDFKACNHEDSRRVLFEEAVQKIDFLAELDGAHRNKLMGMMKPLHYTDGEAIMTQGEMGDKFFIVTEGMVDVLRKDEATDKMNVITRLNAGDFFGEQALLYDTPRSATVQGVGGVEVLYITKQGFEGSRMIYLNVIMDKVALLSSVKGEERKFIAGLLKPQTFADGDYIVRHGEVGDSMYMITEGEAVVSEPIIARAGSGAATAAPAGGGAMSERVLTRIYTGHCIGETSMVDTADGVAATREANVRAAGNVRVMVLAKADFDKAVAQYPDGMLKQNVTRKAKEIKEVRTNRLKRDSVLLKAEKLNGNGDKRSSWTSRLTKGKGKTKQNVVIMTKNVKLKSGGQIIGSITSPSPPPDGTAHDLERASPDGDDIVRKESSKPFSPRRAQPKPVFKWERQINDYMVIKEIGRGSFGSVCLSQHATTGELYAIKIIPRATKDKAGIARSEMVATSGEVSASGEDETQVLGAPCVLQWNEYFIL